MRRDEVDEAGENGVRMGEGARTDVGDEAGNGAVNFAGSGVGGDLEPTSSAS